MFIILQLPPPVLDGFGRVISEAPIDQWQARAGIALAIGKVSPYIPQEEIEPLFEFFVKKSLSDRDPNVRQHMLDAAVAVINDHGKVKKLVNIYLPDNNLAVGTQRKIHGSC